MKILVPIDFSKPSNVAVQYASMAAKKLKAEIVLFHVIYFSSPARGSATMRASSIEDKMIENAQQDCTTLVRKLKSDFPRLKVSVEIIKGNPIESIIESFSKLKSVDLIIMGTKGAGGLKKVLFGSNATAVFSNSTVPVISIPESARFGKGIKKIVCASELSHVKSEMKKLVPVARLLGAEIHVLHVATEDGSKKIDKSKIVNEIVNKYDYNKIKLLVASNPDVLVGIDEYIADVKADILVMFTHNLSFFEKVFGKSVTRQMAFHSTIPILSMKK